MEHSVCAPDERGIPADFVREASGGLYGEAIFVEVNRRLLSGYDLILSIGQVIPHEGLANHLKNIFIGCGGARMINATHIVSAFHGVERVMGRDHTPARRLFDYAERFLKGGFPSLTAPSAWAGKRSRPRDTAICPLTRRPPGTTRRRCAPA